MILSPYRYRYTDIVIDRRPPLPYRSLTDPDRPALPTVTHRYRYKSIPTFTLKNIWTFLRNKNLDKINKKDLFEESE
jgi:hypothetical protein